MKTLCDQDARKRLMMKNIYLQNLKNQPTYKVNTI